MELLIELVTNDVYCYRSYQWGVIPIPCGVLFALRHRFDFSSKDYEVLAADSQRHPTLVRVHADKVEATVTVLGPKWDGPLGVPRLIAPDKLTVATTKISGLRMTGEILLRRIKSNRFSASMGLLRCPASRVFESFIEENEPSLLGTLWPTVSHNGDDLNYVVTPVGLALEGSLAPHNAGADILLLPRGHRIARQSDLCWPTKEPESDRNQKTWFWNNLPPGDWQPPSIKKARDSADIDAILRQSSTAEASNNMDLLDAVWEDAPDPPQWTSTGYQWAMLRWHILTPKRQPVLDACFPSKGAVHLERLSNAQDVQYAKTASDQESINASHGDVIARFETTESDDGALPKPIFNHRGGVCTVAAPVAATIQWEGAGTSSVLTSHLARAGWGPSSAEGGKNLERKHTVLRTVPSAAPPTDALGESDSLQEVPREDRHCFMGRWCSRWFARKTVVETDKAQVPSPASEAIGVVDVPRTDELLLEWKASESPNSKSLTLYETGMYFAGMSDLKGNSLSTSNERPGWLAVTDGFLQLAHSAFSDKNKNAADLVKATTETAQVFRGGLPLDRLGGPQGLTGWVVGHSAQRAPEAAAKIPSVVLWFDDKMVKMTVSRPVLHWRTAAWWAQPVAAIKAKDSTERASALVPSPNWASPGSNSSDPLAPEVSVLGRAFVDCFSQKPEDYLKYQEQLEKALGQVFMGTLWVGRVGEKEGEPWSLKVEKAHATLSIPVKKLPSITVWTGFDDAYLLRTIATSHAMTDGPLLDPFRGLFPLRATVNTKQSLTFKLQTGTLPALEKPIFSNPRVKPAADWHAVGTPGFHPNIGGLSYCPETQKFGQSHAGQMRYDALLRALPDGTIGTGPVTVPLSWVRAVKDCTIKDVFEQNKDHRTATGWLPAEIPLDVDLVELKLGEERPQIQWTIAKQKHAATVFKVKINSHVNQFDPNAYVKATESDKPEVSLVPSSQDARPIVNFGQPLMAFKEKQRLLDGEGRFWKLFEANQRTWTEWANQQEKQRWTEARTAMIGLSEVPSAERAALTVSVLDREDGGGATPVWDIAGPISDGAGSRPFIGPYEIIHASLKKFDDQKTQITARLAPPLFSGVGIRSTFVGGEVKLHWSRKGGSWVLEGNDSTFEWELREELNLPEGGDKPIGKVQIVSIAGVLKAASGGIELHVTQLVLQWDNDLVIRVACSASKIQHVLGEDGKVKSLTFHVNADGSDGMMASLTLRCEDDGHGVRKWSLAKNPGPTIQWHKKTKADKEDSAGPTLNVLTGELSFDQTLFGFSSAKPGKLARAQSSSSEWMVQACAVGLEFTGLLQMIDPEKGGKSTQLRLRYRALTSLNDLSGIFGRCKEGAVRADVISGWQSKGVDLLNAAQSTVRLTGHLVLDNDFKLVTADNVVHSDTVEVYFSEALFTLTDEGELKLPPHLDVMATHTWRKAGATEEPPVLAFQIPQRLAFERSKSNPPSYVLSGASLVLLREGGAVSSDQYEIQLACKPDTHIGVRAAPIPSEQMEGWLLRVPLRTSGTACRLKVPAGGRRPLSWFPVANVPAAVPLKNPAFWYERGALAHMLDPDTLEGMQSQEGRSEMFAGQPLPKDGDELKDWIGFGSGHNWMDSAQLHTQGGAWATPYYVNQVDKPKAAEADRRVSLLVPDPAPTAGGGTRVLAQALVAIKPTENGEVSVENKEILKNWAHSEMRRRSCMTSALVVAHGQPALNVLVTRPYTAFAVLDASHSRALPPEIAEPAYGSMLDFLDASECHNQPAHSGKARRFVARTDTEAVLEVVDALPRVDRAEAATEFRIALRALLGNGGSLVPGVLGCSVMSRQSLEFEENFAERGLPAALPTLDDEDTIDRVVTPVVLDATLWAVRPGESVSTHWSAGQSAAIVGPGVDARLRTPRPNQLANGDSSKSPLSIQSVASANIGGVDWELLEIVSRTTIGRPYHGPLAGVMLTTLVTPRETLHFTATRQSTPPPGSIQVAVRTDVANKRKVMVEPLLCGVFVGAGYPSNGGTLDVAIGLIAARDAKINEHTSVKEILDDPAKRAEWNKKDGNYRAIRLEEWRAASDDPKEPAQYGGHVGISLKKLMEQTKPEPGPSPHWMYDESNLEKNARQLGLFIRTGSGGIEELKFIPMYVVEWLEKAPCDQPERVLAVQDSRVRGFSSLAGPIAMELARAEKQFVCLRSAYALAPRKSGKAGQPPMMAWHFGPSGACVARTVPPNL